jgi:hypothetical protein
MIQSILVACNQSQRCSDLVLSCNASSTASLSICSGPQYPSCCMLTTEALVSLHHDSKARLQTSYHTRSKGSKDNRFLQCTVTFDASPDSPSCIWKEPLLVVDRPRNSHRQFDELSSILHLQVNDRVICLIVLAS